MEELLRRYVKHLELERSISPLTVRNYTGDIQGFLDFLGNNGVDSLDKVNRSTMRLYLGWLHEKGIARASISRKLSALRSFYRYLARENLVEAEPLSTLSSPKLEKRLPTFLTHEEVARLIEAPDASTPHGLRDRAILELLYAAGLRVSEIVALDLKDIDLGSRQIVVWGKGSKERMVLMGRPAAEALKLYLDLGLSPGPDDARFHIQLQGQASHSHARYDIAAQDTGQTYRRHDIKCGGLIHAAGQIEQHGSGRKQLEVTRHRSALKPARRLH